MEGGVGELAGGEWKALRDAESRLHFASKALVILRASAYSAALRETPIALPSSAGARMEV